MHAVLDSNSVHQEFNHKSTKTTNDVQKGDQTIGGVHLFEFHSPGGGMGIGIKVLVFLIIAAAVIYWCLKEKCRLIASRYTNPPIQRTIQDIENALEMGSPRARNAAKDVFMSSSRGD